MMACAEAMKGSAGSSARWSGSAFGAINPLCELSEWFAT